MTPRVKDSYAVKQAQGYHRSHWSRGGFTEVEKTMAIDNGYSVIQSGPRLMRTETAPNHGFEYLAISLWRSIELI